MVMDDPVQKIPTTLVTADSTGAPDAGGQGAPDLTGIEKRSKAEKDNCCWLLPKMQQTKIAVTKIQLSLQSRNSV